MHVGRGFAARDGRSGTSPDRPKCFGVLEDSEFKPSTERALVLCMHKIGPIPIGA